MCVYVQETPIVKTKIPKVNAFGGNCKLNLFSEVV